MPTELTPAWTPMRFHAQQRGMWTCGKRFVIAAAGRRSGKTMNAKRKLVREALRFHRFPDGKFVACAPTRDHAKEIFWRDLKLLTPEWAIRSISESELSITLLSGTREMVIGMDKPERAEGTAIDGAIFDEFQESRERAWPQSLRPSLSTLGREGWAWITGRPRGRNHFYDLYKAAKTRPDWAAFTWPSRDIIAPAEIEAAKADLDELTFQQEYEASFVNFEGRAYYCYSDSVHSEVGLRERYYNRKQPIVFAFDFNVAPGVAAVGQEINHRVHGEVTAWIGQVWIPQNSNTPAVCRKLIADWRTHEGDVYLDGDATGGARGSAKVQGSDWDLILAELRPVFGSRLKPRYPAANPPERTRVNAVNSRLRTADGKVHLLVDSSKASWIALDLEGTTVLKGGSGELDKKTDPMRTHISDAVGYYVARRHPLTKSSLVVESF